MIFDEYDNEVFRDDSDDISTTVDHWEAWEAWLKQLLKIGYGYDSFYSWWIVTHDLECGDFELTFGAEISQQGNLFSSKGSLIETTVEVISHSHCG